MGVGKLLKSRKDIFNKQIAVIRHHSLIIHNSNLGARLKRLRGIPITVEIITLESEKHLTEGHLAAIGLHSRGGDKVLIQTL